MTEIICHHQGFTKRKAKSISLGKRKKVLNRHMKMQEGKRDLKKGKYVVKYK